MIEESEAIKRLKSRNLLAEYREKISKIPETREKAKEVQKKHKEDEFAKILAEIFDE